MNKILMALSILGVISLSLIVVVNPALAIPVGFALAAIDYTAYGTQLLMLFLLKR